MTTSEQVLIEVEGNNVLVSGEDMGGVVDVLLVRYTPYPEDVYIRRGENSGSTIPHRNVVIDVKKVGEWDQGSAVFDLGDEPQFGVERAILLQTGRGGYIIGAARA